MPTLPAVKSVGVMHGARVGQRPWNSVATREGLRMPHSYRIKEQTRLSVARERQQLRQHSPVALGRSMGSRSDNVMPMWSPLVADEFMSPNLEMVTLRAIETREEHLSRLHALLLHGCGPVPSDSDSPGLAAYANDLEQARNSVAETLQALRLAGMEVVEAIVRWRRRRRGHMEPFVWRSHNYLLKMLLDIFFLGLAETVADATRDPFLLGSFAEKPPAGGSGTAGIGGPSAVSWWPKGNEPPPTRGSEAPTTPGSPTRPMSVEPSSVAMLSAPSSRPMTTASPSRRRRAIARVYFSPDRKHTKHELVRMWAAERILHAERTQMGEGFNPISPVLQATDLEIRRNSALLFYGEGEPANMPEVKKMMAPSRVMNTQRERPPDPAYKPLPKPSAPRTKPFKAERPAKAENP